MNLDALIKEAARGGGFRLNVWPTDTGYQANFSRDGNSWSIVMDADATVAVAKVLGGKPEIPNHEDLFA